MAIPNPNPNIEDGKKCDNKTYSSNKIESLIAAATELPTPEAGDAGKVLTVNAAEDGYELDTPAIDADGVTAINTKLNNLEADTISVSLIEGITGVSLPAVVRRGNVAIVRFQISVPAGTYTDIWQLSVNPSMLQNTIMSLGGNIVGVKVSTDGKIGFVSSQTLNASASMIGQLVFTI